MAEINKDTTYYLEVLVTDKDGNGATGLTVTYKVIQCSNNTVIDSGSLTEVGDGVYQGSYLFNTLGQYRIIYITPTKYSNSMETINVQEFLSDQVSDDIKRLLGLCHENMRITDPVYNNSGDLVGGTIKLYRNATDLENDVNPFAIYDASTFYGAGRSKRLVQEEVVKRIQ